jgi:hypothetical protein
MPFSLTCKGCKSNLNVPKKFAGKKIKCPKCSKVVVVPSVAEEEEEPVEVMPDERFTDAPPKKARPRVSRRDDEDDEEEDDRRSRVRSERDSDRSRVRAEDDEDRRPRRPRDDRDEEDDDRDEGPRFKPCPHCGSRRAERVKWTAWGSFYGPALFTHVRCRKCGTTYNGRTGRSNLLAAIVFVTVPLLGILAILAAIFWILRARGRL